ncbi:LysR family transcriptional regulator [Paraburkholderia sediminicola]|uniref:LysR family transcriptional regulator n=1 Tax=Paraburkholderia sediminicola TaxID=458836 RepID=UPI0038B9CAF7
MKNMLNTMLSGLRLRQLQLLIALDEYRSLHKAATALSMTQSAASKALHELESILEERLFDRSPRGVVPNQFGSRMIRYARLMAADLSTLCDDLVDLRSGHGVRLAVGAIMGAMSNLAVPALLRLRELQPDIAIEIVEGTSAELLRHLDEGRLDIVIGRSSVSADKAKYLYLPLGEEPLSVVAGPGHAAASKPGLTLRDLAGQNWISYPTGMPLRTLLEREFDLAGIPTPPQCIATASTYATLAMLQQRDKLVALLPTHTANIFSAHGLIRILPIPLRSPAQTLGIVTRSGSSLPEPAERLIELLRECQTE